MATKVILMAVLLFAVTLCAYLPAIDGGFIWDDDRHVTGNEHLRSAEGLRKIWVEPSAFPQYYPMVLTTFWGEYQLWGLNPMPYHLLNVILHAANAVLLWFLLRALALPGAWLVAAIFALHPVYVESVAWITERKNVLSAFFALSSLLLYLRSFRSGFGDDAERAPSEDAGARWSFYLLSLAFFVLALLSKTTAATLPAVVAVLLWWKRGKITVIDFLRLGPFFAVSAAMGQVTVYMERVYVGTSGAEWSLTVGERIIIAGRALWFYASKLCWSAQLTFSYPRWNIDARLWQSYLFPLAAIAAMVSLWLLRRRLGRGALAGVLIFAGTLVPALGFFDIFPMRYSFVADHFQYLPSIGLIALFPPLLLRRGRQAEAESHLLAALQIDPDHKAARAYLEEARRPSSGSRPSGTR